MRTKYSKIVNSLRSNLNNCKVWFCPMVQKGRFRGYWEQWAKSVADYRRKKQAERITRLIKEVENIKRHSKTFLAGCKKHKPSITQQEAVEMLSHIS